MTWNDLLYQLKQWEQQRPELLDQPVVVKIDSEYLDEDALMGEGMEIDALDLVPVPDYVTDDRLTEPDQLIISP